MKGSRSILGSRVARRILVSFVLASLIPMGIMLALTGTQVRKTDTDESESGLSLGLERIGFDRLVQ